MFYCPKCGDMSFIIIERDKVCSICGTTMKETSHAYNLTKELMINDYSTLEQNEKKFFQEIITKLPEFDMELHNNIDNIRKQREEQYDAVMNAARNAVKCHYCGSTNVQKITLMSKAIHNSIFGIWSLGRNTKEFHCNNCGADF